MSIKNSISGRGICFTGTQTPDRPVGTTAA